MAKNDVFINGMSVVTKDSGGTVIASPDVCKTPMGSAVVPVPYVNVAKSGDLDKGSKTVKINGAPVCLKDSNFKKSTGNEPGTAGGVMSGVNKGKAHPITYSMDVFIEGKPVVRNMDLFINNDYNTPPARIMQSQSAPPPATVKAKEEKPKCPYCEKDEHKYSQKTGSNRGASVILASKIFKEKEKETHQWNAGVFSLEAHHLICSEAMDEETKWPEYCSRFGYNINHKHNGVMLPNRLDLACQLGVAVHRGGHARGWADDLHLPYPEAVKKKIKPIADAIEEGEFCDNPEGVVKELDAISLDILSQIDSFSWTISSDGKDYMPGGNGCCGAKNIPDKIKGNACPHNRNHGIKHGLTKAVIPQKTKPLQIGE